jgi:S-adenosylmethionine:tRNA ribosyltransferase-isomerase
MNVAEFDYELPPELIAQYPAECRDQSRLMVVNRADHALTHTTFAQLPEWLNPSDVLVLNDTKVIPARLQGHKTPSGGKVEIFLLRYLHDTVWEVLIGGKVKSGIRIAFGDGKLSCIIREKNTSGKGIVEFDQRENLQDLLHTVGTVPLPPYIKRPQGVLPSDETRYQTVYAQHEGAVAAPTAGLHFSENLLKQIRAKGVQIVTLTLHVGIGTFQPVKVERVEDHQIMPEWYEISEPAAQQITQALQQQQRIIAVGTTTTRLLETVYQSDQTIHAGSGWADIFIYPGFQFHVTQALITNFHLPRSSLLMLVSAFGGMELLRHAYQEAIAQRYRFYSYGDAMLIV